ncbi:glycosyltransferase [Halomonas urmiana]|uniref:Glycosyltransferase n=1 Tax=Halomonas urmiana TaxID=490901 RepID=A0A5R8M8K6_9GAMM|nr:glycosyltransferase [Halomonas urmiana]TLF45908.1 glycosyltransferase [Halomonas urmiana]
MRENKRGGCQPEYSNNQPIMPSHVNMKIYYVSPSFYPAIEYGGPIFSTLHTCRELIRKGVVLDIHSTNVSRKGRLEVQTSHPVELKNIGGQVWYHRETIANRISLSLLRHMPRSVKNSDLVHTQSIFSISTPASIIFAKVFGKPVVVSPRGSLGEWCVNQGSKLKKSWLNFFFKPFINNIYWHVTADSEKMDVLRFFPEVKNDKFLIVPNGVDRVIDNPVSREELESNLKINLPDKYVLSVGRVDKKKGFDFTIQSLTHLDESMHLVVAGEDYGEKDNLLGMVDDLGLKGRVHFVGQVEGPVKASLYFHAMIFMLNSRHENFGNVYLESLSYGTPIVASDNTPWGFIDEAGAGCCVSNEPELIADKASFLLGLVESGGAELADRCVEVASGFYWENIAENFVKEYDRIIKVENENHGNYSDI